MRRGDVYRFDLDPTIGSELQKLRPCVIVMDDPGGRSAVTIVCPLTDARGRPGNLLNPAIASGVAGTTKDSRIACHQIRALDKARVHGERLGIVPDGTMRDVDRGLRAILGLG